MKTSHKQIHEIKVIVTNPKTKEEASDAIKRLSKKLTYALSSTNNGVIK